MSDITRTINTPDGAISTNMDKFTHAIPNGTGSFLISRLKFENVQSTDNLATLVGSVGCSLYLLNGADGKQLAVNPFMVDDIVPNPAGGSVIMLKGRSGKLFVTEDRATAQAGISACIDAGGATAGVASFNGRVGVVAPAANDYQDDEVSSTTAPANYTKTASAGLLADFEGIDNELGNLKSVTGQYVGSAATFAALPTTGFDGEVVNNGDWAFLTADDGGNVAGAYVTNGTAYTLAFELPEFSLEYALLSDVIAGTDTNKLINSSTGAGAYEMQKFNKYDATAAPTANDDSVNTSGDAPSANGFKVGSRWFRVDAGNEAIYECVDATLGAAIWKRVDNEATASAEVREVINGAAFTYEVLSGTPVLTYDVSTPTSPVLTVAGGTIKLKRFAVPTTQTSSTNYVFTLNATFEDALAAYPSSIEKYQNANGLLNVGSSPQLIVSTRSATQCVIELKFVSIDMDLVARW